MTDGENSESKAAISMAGDNEEKNISNATNEETERQACETDILTTDTVYPIDCNSLQELETLENVATEPKVYGLPNGITENSLEHPAYKLLLNEVSQLKKELSGLHSEISRLEAENQRLEAEKSHEIYLLQIETLEKTIEQQKREFHLLREKASKDAEIAAKNYSQMQQSLEGKLVKMTKQYEQANKEKESMVMRYAVSEKEVIDQKKEREILEKKWKEAVKEQEFLNSRLKMMSSEKTRICEMLDVKTYEAAGLKKENDKLKEDLNSCEIKIKWAQNKLRLESDSHKETQTKLEQVTLKLQEAREECEHIRQDCQANISAFRESEDNKAYTLDKQLKEQQAKLIMERYEREDNKEYQRQLQQEVENLKKKHEAIIDENNTLSVKVQNLEKERLEYTQNLSKLKTSNDKQKQDIADLQSQLSELENMRVQLQYEQERLAASQSEVERLRESNSELQQDMAVCGDREAELLEFTQKLTDKNVRLQSEFSAMEAKAAQLDYERSGMERQISDLESRVNSLTKELEQEHQQRQEENQLLARHLAEKTQQLERLTQKLEDQQGENQVLQRKHAAALKEMTRELSQCRKRLETYEISSCNNSLGHGSRASSSSSLNTAEDHIKSGLSKVNSDHNSPSFSNCTDTHSSGQEDPSSSHLPIEPDRQMLVERIVKLQRANARKTEKLEFLEEHVNQLVNELQKKSRIVLNYIMREQSGALAPESMDLNKVEVAKHGGIMASVYSSKVVDSTMTLDLSLEINRKLQAVLEDTLLKNITLKENIDTLGAEISRLMTEKVKS